MCPVTRCLCNQNKASPQHLSHWSSGQVSFIWLFTLALFCVNVEFPVFACLRRRRRRKGEEGVSVEVASFPNIVTRLPGLFWMSTLHNLILIPPSMHLLSRLQNDGDQRASIVYCSAELFRSSPGAEAFDICGRVNQGCLPGKPSPPTPWMPPLSLTSASAVLQAPLTWKCAASSGSNAVAQVVFPVKRKGRLMFVWAEKSRFPDRDPHHIHNNLAVKHTACRQLPGLWSDGPHDSEEESRIREKEWEEERRRRVIYRVKEYRIQMCNKMRWGGCWSMWPLMALDLLGLTECVTLRARVWMLSSPIRFNSGTH